MGTNRNKEQIERKHPDWLVRRWGSDPNVGRMETYLDGLELETVCRSAHCPNIAECYGRGVATFMILGARCTRRCRFCAVEKGAPQKPDADEPERVARAAKSLRLKHVVVTSVTRDDLPDGGARHFARTVECIREQCGGVTVEVLIPDFKGSLSALQEVCAVQPDILNHNVETVESLYEAVRPQAEYSRSLGVLEYASTVGLKVKSGLMIGLGETREEIIRTMTDLKRAGCNYLTLGQYLAPSKDHAPVARYVSPEEFRGLGNIARELGIGEVMAGPLVRSSYKADMRYDALC
jgi:lipoic acid synthetase